MEKQSRKPIAYQARRMPSGKLNFEGMSARPRDRWLTNPSQQQWWDTRAAAHDWNLEDEIKELEKLTAARERLQRRLRMARTGREYINHGDNSNLGERFQLLNPELNSATSVQNYMGRFMAGSSLFASEW
jgi:hypothetical protein